MDEEIEESYQRFLCCDNLKEFLSLWASFYENEVYIPGYLSKFVAAGDNPEATFEMGKKFQEITKCGVICTSSQVTILGKQKGYITAFINQSIRKELVEDLNRYSGIVAFTSKIFYKQDCYEGHDSIYVTYDKNCKGYSRVHAGDGGDYGSYSFIRKYLNNAMCKIFNSEDYCFLTIINPSYESSPEYCIDVLLECLKEN